MTTQTIPRPSEIATDRTGPDRPPSELDRKRTRRLAAVTVAVVAAAMAFTLAIAGDDGGATSDGSWERAELRRMLALDQPAVDTSSDFAERQRHLRRANDDNDGSFDVAESARHSRLEPTGDTSHDEAEHARQWALAPEADTSHEEAEFKRMTRIGR